MNAQLNDVYLHVAPNKMFMAWRVMLAYLHSLRAVEIATKNRDRIPANKRIVIVMDKIAAQECFQAHVDKYRIGTVSSRVAGGAREEAANE